MEEWMTEGEAAGWLKLDRADLLEAVSRGEVPVLRVAGQVRFSRSSLIAAAARTMSAPLTDKAEAGEGDVDQGRVAPPAAFSWIDELLETDGFDKRWPAKAEKGKGSGSSFEKYPNAWAGRVRADGVGMVVKVGQSTGAERSDGKPRLTVLLENYPMAEFIPTSDGAGWASVIKPDGKHTVAPGDPLPAIYRKARTASYQQATGESGPGRPTGAAVIIGVDDRESAVYHAVGRWLGKRGRAY